MGVVKRTGRNKRCGGERKPIRYAQGEPRWVFHAEINQWEFDVVEQARAYARGLKDGEPVPDRALLRYLLTLFLESDYQGVQNDECSGQQLGSDPGPLQQTEGMESRVCGMDDNGQRSTLPSDGRIEGA